MSVANQLDKPATSSFAWSCNLITKYLQKSLQTSLTPSTNVLPTKPSLTNNLWSPLECHQIIILFASLSSFIHLTFKITIKLLIRRFSEMLFTMPFQTHLVNAPWASLPNYLSKSTLSDYILAEPGQEMLKRRQALRFHIPNHAPLVRPAIYPHGLLVPSSGRLDHRSLHNRSTADCP